MNDDEEFERLRAAVDAATDPEFIEEVMVDATDIDVGLDDYARAIARAIERIAKGELK